MIHGIITDGVENFISEEEIRRMKSGDWENEDVFLVKKYLHSSDSVLELGGCTGVLSCVINKCIEGRHTVIEPNPEMIDCIAAIRDQNGCNFHIKNNIISENEEEEFQVWDFRLGSGAPKLNGRTIKDNPYGNGFRTYKIPGISLSLEKKDFNVLFCDIEGAEYSLIKNNYSDLLGFNKLFFEFHYRFNNSESNLSTHNQCINILKKNYKLVEQVKNVYYFEKL